MTPTKKSKVTKKAKEDFSASGEVGGKALFKKVGKKGMKKLGANGAAARWAGHDKCRAKPCRHTKKKA